MRLQFKRGGRMAGKIFVNYRREDAQDAAARVHKELVPAFGAKTLFMDVDNLLAGKRFDKELDKALAACDVFLAIIGPRWLAIFEERQAAGKRDFVREEIAAALKREIPVIPVLVNGAQLPDEGALPGDVSDLVKHQQHEIRFASFGRDMGPLVGAIRTLRREAGGGGGVPWRGIAAGMVVLGAVVVGLAIWHFAPVPILGPKAEPAATTVPSRPDQTTIIAMAERRVAAENEAARADADRKVAQNEAEAKAVGDNPFLAARAKVQSKPGTVFVDDSCPGGCPEMVALPQGKYLRGSPDGETGRSADEGPQKTVTIGYDLAVGRYEVTRDQFEAFVTATNYKVADQCYVRTGTEFKLQAGSFRKPGFDQDGTHPAVCISWDDAKAYATWLAKVTGKQYRLLTEAEWEYAARGVTEPTLQPRYPWGNVVEKLCANGNGADQTAKSKFKDWSDVADCKDGFVFTAPIGSFQPNAFGLYDTLGNAWEWVQDCYPGSYNDAPVDGSAVKDSSTFCLGSARGGSWYDRPFNLRPASRYGFAIGNRLNYLGFRLAKSLSGT